MNKAVKRYTVRMLAAFGFYTVAVVGLNLLDDNLDLAQWLRISLSLVPVLPAIAMVFIALTFIRTLDEVQQRVITESMLVSAIVVGLASFTWGFLEGVMSLPEISLIWVLPALVGLQGVLMPLVRQRYR